MLLRNPLLLLLENRSASLKTWLPNFYSLVTAATFPVAARAAALALMFLSAAKIKLCFSLLASASYSIFLLSSNYVLSSAGSTSVVFSSVGSKSVIFCSSDFPSSFVKSGRSAYSLSTRFDDWSKSSLNSDGV